MGFQNFQHHSVPINFLKIFAKQDAKQANSPEEAADLGLVLGIDEDHFEEDDEEDEEDDDHGGRAGGPKGFFRPQSDYFPPQPTLLNQPTQAIVGFKEQG